MGGGGAIRAAAKLGAGWGSVAGGIRHGGGVPNFNPASAARPVSAVMNSSSSPEVAADLQKPCQEVDGWILAGTEEVVQSGSDEPIARMVFGPTATMEEATEATSELKEALEQVYLSSSPDSTGWVPTILGRVSGMSALSNSEHSETKPCVTSEMIIADPAPNTALQAFKLLSESTTAQTVVASIACDQNVWNAVLSNPKLVEFLETQKNGSQLQEMDKESVADSDSQYQDTQKFENIPDYSLAGRAGAGFADVMQSIKVKVLQMVSGVSDILQSIFTPSVADHKEADGDSKFSAKKDLTQAAPLMGLAVLVIMVVLLKRV